MVSGGGSGEWTEGKEKKKKKRNRKREARGSIRGGKGNRVRDEKQTLKREKLRCWTCFETREKEKKLPCSRTFPR